MKKRYWMILVLLGTVQGLFAQEDLRREYEQFRRAQVQEFNEYVSRENRAFADFLKREWKLFRDMQAVEHPSGPKPDKAPSVPGREIPEVPGPVVKPLPVALLPVPQPVPSPVVPAKLPQTLGLTFFDCPVSVPFSDRLRVAVGGATEAQVAAFWERMSAAPYQEFIRTLQQAAEKLGVNDWGYFRLAETVAGQVFDGASDRAAFVFYVLKQSGYDVRLGRRENQLFLLATFTTQVYGLSYFVLDGKNYYRLDGGSGPLYTFGESGALGDSRAMDLRQLRPLVFESKIQTRILKPERFPEMEIRVPYSLSRVAYYNSIPQTDLPVYFSYPLPRETWQALYDAFAPLAAKHSLPEFVGILLHFVQTSFDYKTDDGQFGREKYFFPEEVIAYPYCDCEDRSVFFACLVRNLTGAGVIGLGYPGHIATAVCFGDADVAGDSLVHRGKKYVVCDPTYINASVGMTMPQFRTLKPKVIEF